MVHFYCINLRVFRVYALNQKHETEIDRMWTCVECDYFVGSHHDSVVMKLFTYGGKFSHLICTIYLGFYFCINSYQNRFIFDWNIQKQRCGSFLRHSVHLHLAIHLPARPRTEAQVWSFHAAWFCHCWDCRIS